MEDPKGELERALQLEDETERMLAVQYWTRGAYTTADIDVLLPHRPEIDRRFEALGFEHEGRHWRLPGRDVLVEAPDSFPAYNEEVAEVHLSGGRRVFVLSPEDVLIYRLHEFVGTGSRDVASQTVTSCCPRTRSRPARRSHPRGGSRECTCVVRGDRTEGRSRRDDRELRAPRNGP